MAILLLFAFISGLVTILAPCIWPLLPIVLSASATGGRKKPLGVTLGIIISFMVNTLLLAYILRLFSFDPDILRYISVGLIALLGLMLVVPAFGRVLEGWVSKVSGKIAPVTAKQGDGFGGGFVVGLALGIMWTPCAGPILAAVATLVATQALSFQAVLVTGAYAVGVGVPLFIFATVGRRLFSKSQVLNKYTGRIQQVFGVIMILTAIAIFTNYDKTLQTKLLDAVPAYSELITNLESNDAVEGELDRLRGNEQGSEKKKSGLSIPKKVNPQLQNYGIAPEFVGINQWLNSDPLTMENLKGKVVLIDFWTYTCINCIRTLPHVTSWYETYKDDGFVIVGVHTPEFAFEKKTSNVEAAIAQYNINYPVAQDNDYSTWRAYENRYWPAHYLVDAEGVIRYVHFGEGKYEETEKAIKDLLEEAGNSVNKKSTPQDDNTPTTRNTHETYLGLSRIEHFSGDNSLIKKGTSVFSSANSIAKNKFAFEGEWMLDSEYAQSGQDASIEINFVGKKVFLVITSDQPGGKIEVLLDGKAITSEDAGIDVESGVVILDQPRLYEIVDFGNSQENHTLRLQFLDPEIRVFAFTFG